jgi:hypothetical protein
MVFADQMLLCKSINKNHLQISDRKCFKRFEKLEYWPVATRIVSLMAIHIFAFGQPELDNML